MTRKRLWLAFVCVALCACVSASPRPLDDNALAAIVGKGKCEMCANACVWGGSEATCFGDKSCDSYVTCPGGDFQNHVWAGRCYGVTMDVTCETYETWDEVDCGQGFGCYCMASPPTGSCFVSTVYDGHTYNTCGY